MNSGIWLLGPVFGFLAYHCSRGKDGRLFDALFGFAVLGIVYGILVSKLDQAKSSLIAAHFVVFEAFVIGALVINPQLDEMGGMLNILLPLFVIGVIGIGAVVRPRSSA